MGIRDKAKKAGEVGKVDAKPVAAPPKPSTKPSEGPKAPSGAVAVATKEEPKAPSPVTDIRDHMVDNLSDEDVEKFLARQASGPLVAGLAATRETKLRQVQYDGTTADGYIVRIWAPEGAEMLVKARLETVA